MPELSAFRNGAGARGSVLISLKEFTNAGTTLTLRSLYERFIRNLWLVVSNRCWVVQVIKGEAPPGGSNGCDSSHDDAVPGKHRVLCAIPGSSGQGVQGALDFATGRAFVPAQARGNPATAGTQQTS